MTFEYEQPNYSSVNDDILFVAYDAKALDPVTYPNYKYIADLYVSGVKVFTSRIFPNPTNDRGIFNFGAIIREYCNSLFDAAFQEDNDFWVDVYVNLKDEINGEVSTVLATSSTLRYYNYYKGRASEIQTISTTYENATATDRPSRIVIPDNATNYFIPFWKNTGATDKINFDIITASSETPTSITMLPDDIMYKINLLDYIDANTIAIRFTDPSTDQTYTIERVCAGLYRNYYVHFLNKWGGYETMLFNKVSRKAFDIERKDFQQLAYRVSASGIVTIKSNDIMYKQRTMYGVRFNEKLKLGTDVLTDAEYQWLAQLVVSPEVYIEDAGTIYPCVIIGTNYEFKEHIIDGITSLQIDVEFGTKFKTQFQ